ncbi:NPCBM/NEW2 domain-containing protein [Streptomyces sp. IBSBF 2435]|uniref:NPCBM/NEW2 domain-containing protein n=1 Tax=Streptomyces sp. IBSBF 2435 TaxID=2903531 RepID=UPI002FDC6D63
MADEKFVQVPQDAMRERRGLAGRLKMLRQATKKSQREFADILGVDHSTVSVYEKPDGRVPDLEYIDGFLAEVASRSDVTADVLKDTRDSYGRLLRLLCDQPHERGRTHNYRQLLRVYELTVEREALTAELAQVREQQRDVEEELTRLRQDSSAGTSADPEREQQLRETAATLQQRRGVLIHRRDTVVSDLDAYHAQLRQSRIPAPPSSPPTIPNNGGWTVGAPRQRSLPPSPSRNTRPHATATTIVAGALVVLLLGGWLIYRTTSPSPSHDTADQQPAPSPTVTASRTRSPSPYPSLTPTSAEPATMLLTDLPSVAVEKDNLATRSFEVGDGTVDNIHYANALVSSIKSNLSFLDCEDASGYSEYNLGHQWKKLTMVLGIDDNSTDQSAQVTITLDGRTLYKNEVRLDKTQRVPLGVTNGLRLRISFNDTDPNDSECRLGKVVIGNPTLSR